MPSPPDASLLYDLAARPRGTGSVALDTARARCALDLRSLGFDVREQSFEYSSFPGRYATPLFGAAVAVLVGIAGSLSVVANVPPVIPGVRVLSAVILLSGGLVLFGAGRWLVQRGVLTMPLLRARGKNLIATRGGAWSAIWLCAHLDSKSQPIPTLVRSTGLVLEAAGATIATVLACMDAAGVRTSPLLWLFAALVTLLGAIPVMVSVVTFHSPGALDNASGVATVIAAARLLGRRNDVGVLITDAEELGLAGARAWSDTIPQPTGTVLNCDGVDDVGRIAVMFSGRRPNALLGAVARASGICGVAHESMRMVPGMLTDSVAFADAGLASVTFSRGSWRSLARVHSRRDDLAHLRGTGVAETATLMAATAMALGDTA